MADGSRVLSLLLLLASVERLPRGEYAEVGTWRGYSARIIFSHKAKGSEFHCFDTFEGFDDRDVATELQHDKGWCRPGKFAGTSPEMVRQYVARDSPDAGSLHLHEGFFPATFSGLEDRIWRFVHLDADLYEPTYAALERFYPRLVSGGAIIVHDYNSFYYDGVARAVDDYFGPRGITPVQMPDGAGSAVIIKTAADASSIAIDG